MNKLSDFQNNEAVNKIADDFKKAYKPIEQEIENSLISVNAIIAAAPLPPLKDGV